MSLAYFLSAKLGLMLAVPPGYASPVFPAAGIALAGILIIGYRCWPGVFLGSLMLNLSITGDPTVPSSTLDTVLLAGGIASGAALQAVTGAYLVRRFSAFPVPFSDWRRVVAFLFWGGPASCVVNAVIGVSALEAAGKLPLETFLYNSATWWIGDTFGVLIFVPLILIWTSPRDRIQLSTRLTATLPAAVTFALAVIVVWHATSWERARVQHHFDRQAMFLSLAFEKSLYGDMMAVTSLQSFATTVAEFDRREFRGFVAGVMANNGGIQALSWNPIVSEAERAAFEGDVRQSGVPNFQITERNESEQLQPASQRPEYVVVRFIEPQSGNETALGFDVSSDPIRKEALDLARDTGGPVVTGRVNLVQDETRQFGILIFAPVYDGTQLLVDPTQGRRALKGFVVGILRIGDVVENALSDLDTNDVVFRLVDNTAPMDQQVLYESPPRAGGVPILRDKGLFGGSSALLYEYRHKFGERQWTLQLFPTQKYIAKHRPEYAWIILSGGLLISGIVTAFTVVLVGRNDALSALVDGLSAAKAEADKASQAKTEFLAAMSHDLRTPLNAIMGFSDMMRNRVFGDLGNPRYEEYARDIHQSGKFLLSLIDDVLDTSKIEAGRYQLKEETVNVSELIGRCLHMIDPRTQKARIRLATDVPGNLAQLRCDGRVVAQTLNNLLSNAVKFTREGGQVRLSARMDDSGALIVKVSDSGIGMSDDEKTRALEPFGQGRLRHAGQGTGLGLYLCVRFMELHGGTLDIRSRKGSGTTVSIRFPPHRTVAAKPFATPARPTPTRWSPAVSR